MSLYEIEPIPQIVILLFGLVFGPWLTISGIRVMTEPARVKEKSLINWFIRMGATHHPIWKGNVYFLAHMVFVAGVILDTLGVLAMVALIRVLLN
jgi:hypothetical protein